ncbi:MAG: hypothetical protein ACOYBQ_00025 [Fluviibacter sp.]
MSNHINRSGFAIPEHTPRQVTLTYLVVLQALPAFGVLALGIPSYAMFELPIPWMNIALIIGAVSFFLTYLASYPWRYRIIEALIAPAIWLILRLTGIV